MTFSALVCPCVTFGKYVKAKLTELDLRPAELARRTGMTKQNLGRIINDTPHWQTGALPRVTVETVDKIAVGLGINKDEVRIAAGYAPETGRIASPPPTNLAELVQALEDLGLPVPQMYGGFQIDDDGAGFEEALDRIRLDLELVMKRVAARRQD